MTDEIDGYDDDYERPSLVEDRNHRNHWLNRANDLHASAGAIWYSMRSDNHQAVTEKLGLEEGSVCPQPATRFTTCCVAYLWKF